MKKLLLTPVFVALLAGCGESDPFSADPDDFQGVGGTWSAVSWLITSERDTSESFDYMSLNRYWDLSIRDDGAYRIKWRQIGSREDAEIFGDAVLKPDSLLLSPPYAVSVANGFAFTESAGARNRRFTYELNGEELILTGRSTVSRETAQFYEFSVDPVLLIGVPVQDRIVLRRQ